MGVHSAAFAHQITGYFQTMYSLMRRHGLGPALDSCQVQLEINAPLPPCNGDIKAGDFHPNSSWPSCHSWFHRPYINLLSFLRPILKYEPTFYRAFTPCSPRNVSNLRRISPVGQVKCGWCHEQEGAIEIPLIPLPLEAPPGPQAASQEKAAQNYLNTALGLPESPEISLKSSRISHQSPGVSDQSPVVSNQSPEVSSPSSEVSDQSPEVSERSPEVSGKSPEVSGKSLKISEKSVVLRLPKDQDNAYKGKRFEGNARHNSELHRQIVSSLDIPPPSRERGLRVTLILRSLGTKLTKLPKIIDAPTTICRPRRLLNRKEVENNLRTFCDQDLTGNRGTKLCEFQAVDYAGKNGVEQERIAARSDVYITYHGSSLTHCAFLPDHSIVVEIFPTFFFLSWHSLMETEMEARGISWVFATHKGHITAKKCVHGTHRLPNSVDASYPITVKNWNCGTRFGKDTCRAWNPNNTLSMLQFALTECHPSKRRDFSEISGDFSEISGDSSEISEKVPRNCLREAMRVWQKRNSGMGEWVMKHRRRAEFTFLEIEDDAIGLTDQA
ncbi:hypothetical protein AAMO2058_000277800 [Amorphochlora amoebiformis]